MEEPVVAEKAAADVPAEPEPLKKAKETKAVSEVVVLEFQSESFDITSIRERCRQAWLDQSGGSAESVRKAVCLCQAGRPEGLLGCQ